MDLYDQTLYFGELYPDTRKAIIMIHGRGSEAADIVNGFIDLLPLSDYYIVAPNAANRTWYPYSFIAPVANNEPKLSEAIDLLNTLLTDLLDTGYKPEDIYLLGFSQGACLALEFAARTGGTFGGVFALSGGLIGEQLNKSLYHNLNNTPVFIGCSDIDSHIPLHRVHESTGVFKELGAKVTEKIYPGMGHTINRDELEHIKTILK